MRWDLTPFRPWEEALVDAEDWITAHEIQAAYRAGVEEANAELKERQGQG